MAKRVRLKGCGPEPELSPLVPEQLLRCFPGLHFMPVKPHPLSTELVVELELVIIMFGRGAVPVNKTALSRRGYFPGNDLARFHEDHVVLGTAILGNRPDHGFVVTGLGDTHEISEAVVVRVYGNPCFFKAAVFNLQFRHGLRQCL